MKENHIRKVQKSEERKVKNIGKRFYSYEPELKPLNLSMLVIYRVSLFPAYCAIYRKEPSLLLMAVLLKKWSFQYRLQFSNLVWQIDFNGLWII